MIPHTLAVMALVFVTAITDTAAEERIIWYEFGESGQRVSFTMTAEEIAAQNAAKDRLQSMPDAFRPGQKKWVRKFELAESGTILEFPMSNEEIRLAKEMAA